MKLLGLFGGANLFVACLVVSFCAVGVKVASTASGQTECELPKGVGGPGVGFDRSGLLHYAWGRAGVTVPHFTVAMWTDPDFTHITDPTQLQPGDMVMFEGPPPPQRCSSPDAARATPAHDPRSAAPSTRRRATRRQLACLLH